MFQANSSVSDIVMRRVSSVVLDVVPQPAPSASRPPLPKHMLQRWIEERLCEHADCMHPVPDPNRLSGNFCECGREIALHPAPPEGAGTDLPPRWSARTHTPLVPTTTYGLLVFQDPPNTISSFTDEVRVCPMGKE